MHNADKATFWAKRLGKCPGVAAIFLSGSVAQGRDTENSDIDFFILAHPGQIWTARFFVFVWLKLAGEISKPSHHAGKICPNHFVTTDTLEIAEKDAYSAHLFSHNQPLYDPEGWFSVFAKQNSWVQNFGESFPKFANRHKARSASKVCFLEPWLKALQTKIIKQNPEYQTPGARIVLTDTELRFHPKPRNKNWSK